MKNSTYKILFFVAIFLFSREVVFASDFSADLITQSDTKSSIKLKVDTGSEKINTFDLRIGLPIGFEVDEIRDSKSIIPVWIERPSVDKNRTLSFSGIIPGGYSGVGELITVTGKTGTLFKSKQNIFVEGSIYKNDGLGTEVRLGRKIVELVNDKNEKIITEDTTPPELFTLQKFSSEDESGQEQKYIAFSTTDKGSGIKKYAVNERSWWKFFTKNYEDTNSPYELKDQAGRSIVSVRAIDNFGNEREVVLYPEIYLFPYESYLLYFIIIVFIVRYARRIIPKKVSP